MTRTLITAACLATTLGSCYLLEEPRNVCNEPDTLEEAQVILYTSLNHELDIANGDCDRYTFRITNWLKTQGSRAKHIVEVRTICKARSGPQAMPLVLEFLGRHKVDHCPPDSPARDIHRRLEALLGITTIPLQPSRR